MYLQQLAENLLTWDDSSSYMAPKFSITPSSFKLHVLAAACRLLAAAADDAAAWEVVSALVSSVGLYEGAMKDSEYSLDKARPSRAPSDSTQFPGTCWRVRFGVCWRKYGC